MYRLLARLARGTWTTVQILSTLLVVMVALQFSPLIRRAEAQFIGLTPGSTLGNAASGLFQTITYAFNAGVQIGGTGYPISAIYSVSFPISATSMTSATDAVITASVPGSVTGTFSSGGTFLTATASTIVCSMTSYTTATAGQPAGTSWKADLLTGTSSATGTSAAPLLVRVAFSNPNSVSLTPGTMRCDVIAH